MKPIKIVNLTFFLFFLILNSFCQKIEYVDSSKVYILTIFRFENEKEHLNTKHWSTFNNQNTLQVILLKANDDIQNKLITGDNKYNFISINDSLNINFIDTIIKNYAISNLYFLTNWKYNPISSFDSTLYIYNSDIFLINKYLTYRNNPVINNYINKVYMNTFFDDGDIVEGRIINPFKSYQIGYSNRFKEQIVNHSNQFFFSEKGTYYMLLKVNLIYVIIDDINMDYLYCDKNPINGLHSQYDDYFYIYDKIPVRIKYLEKNNKKPIAIPLYIELLKPFNDKYHFYWD